MSRNPLTTKHAKVLRKGRKGFSNYVLALHTLYLLRVLCS